MDDDLGSDYPKIPLLSEASVLCPSCGHMIPSASYHSHHWECWPNYCKRYMKHTPPWPVSASTNLESFHTTVPSDKNQSSNDKKSVSLGRKTGTHCAICEAKKSFSQVHQPMIALGQYRRFMICKKEHFADEKDRQTLQDLLEEELASVTKNGDTVFSEGENERKLLRGSDEAIPPTTPLLACTCHGFTSLNPQTPCTVSCSNILSVCTKGSEGGWVFQYAFCKPTHLIRYLLKTFSTGKKMPKPPGKKRARTTKQTTSKPVKKSQKNKEKQEDDDVEEEEGEVETDDDIATGV